MIFLNLSLIGMKELRISGCTTGLGSYYTAPAILEKAGMVSLVKRTRLQLMSGWLRGYLYKGEVKFKKGYVVLIRQ